MTYAEDYPDFDRNDFATTIARLALDTWDNDTPWVFEFSLNSKGVSAMISLDFQGLAVADRGDQKEFMRIVRNRRVGYYKDFLSSLSRTYIFGEPLGVTILMRDEFPNVVISGKLLEDYDERKKSAPEPTSLIVNVGQSTYPTVGP